MVGVQGLWPTYIGAIYVGSWVYKLVVAFSFFGMSLSGSVEMTDSKIAIILESSEGSRVLSLMRFTCKSFRVRVRVRVRAGL